MRWTAVLLFVLALGAALQGLVRLNTWYLASDQYAFLTFAADLRSGTVFHQDPTYELIAPRTRRPFDALSQTYLWVDQKMFSRYPPGFPMMLAAVGAVFGEQGEHWLNPVLYLFVFATLAASVYLLVRAHDHAAAAAGAAGAVWLLLLLPTDVHLWGITVARDLPAHLLGMFAVLMAALGRFGLSGVALGMACTIRPDAGLYAASLLAIAAIVHPRPRDVALGTAAFLVSLSPLLVYNTLVMGNPLSFTQGNEFRYLFGADLPSVRVESQAVRIPSGGAFQVAHLAETLPGNAAIILTSFGWFLALAAFGLVWALRARRIVAAAFAPYAIVGFFFYGFWGHPDARYLVGVSLCLMPLAALGAGVAARIAADPGRSGLWRLGFAVVGALMFASHRGHLPGLPAPTQPEVWVAASILSLGVVAYLPAAVSRLHRLAPILPPIALAAVGLLLLSGSSGRRDPVQFPQVERAREAIRTAIPESDAVIVTHGNLGRTAENITHYTGRRAIYVAEVDLLHVPPETLVLKHLAAGRAVYLLLHPHDTWNLERFDTDSVTVERVGHRRGEAGLEWFVNPRRAPEGAVLFRVRFSEEFSKVREFLREQGLIDAESATSD